MPRTVEPSFSRVDYRNNDNITLSVDNETGYILGYTTYGGIAEDSDNNSYYFEGARNLLPEDFFEGVFESYKYVLLKEPYEVRKNPDYEKIKEQKEEEERKQREKTPNEDTISREEYDSLKSELEELKRLIQQGGK